MPRQRTEDTLAKKKADIQAALAELQQKLQATERAERALQRKRQLAWEARIGRLAWEAGLHHFSDAQIVTFFESLLETPPEMLCASEDYEMVIAGNS